MFEADSIVYTEQDIYSDDETKVFNAFQAYTVYNVEIEDGKPKELVLVNELGMLHAVEDIKEYFQYQH